MARPLSEEKRHALLTAAANEVASTGIAASTIKIAKNAGVAEGTLFVYFPTKDELLNQLYLYLKSDLISFLANDYPTNVSIEKQIEYIWTRYLDWGASNPNKRRALSQLNVSEKITMDIQNAAEIMFENLQNVVANAMKEGILREQPIYFLGEIINSLADMVLEMTFRNPEKLLEYKVLGWKALWGAIAHK